jgi:hypothetical protein
VNLNAQSYDDVSNYNNILIANYNTTSLVLVVGAFNKTL